MHGDAGPSNIGFTDDQVVLLDWQLASIGPGVFDLVCVLNHENRIDATPDELLDDVRAASGSNHDEFTLQLAILANLPFACALWAAADTLAGEVKSSMNQPPVAATARGRRWKRSVKWSAIARAAPSRKRA